MSFSQMPEPARTLKPKPAPGVALISTLAVVAILTIVLVTLVTIAQYDQSASNTYSQSIKAEEIGRGSLQLLIGELQKEMEKDAPPDRTYPDYPVFLNVSATNILPQRVVGPNPDMLNLVKLSATTPFFSGSNTSLLQSSTANSITPSINQRSMSLARWNRTSLGTFPNNASTPNWVILTRSGPAGAASLTFGRKADTLNNPILSNTNYAIGRFAYAIYDEGGLLNINVAGYPDSAVPFAAGKGTSVWADLGQIPGISKPNDLVLWRNALSATSGTQFLANVDSVAAPGGFARVSRGDTTFLSRMELIRYAQNNPAVLGTSALPYLGTFSRDANAPGWGPTTIGSGSFQYKTNANNPLSQNRFFPNVKVTRTFTRLDGTVAKVGDSLVNKRFPLSRLGLLSFSGSSMPDSQIDHYFGLTRSGTSRTWVYNSSTILTLKQVADSGREPNFFELLQASLLNGSLGKAGGLTIADTRVPDANFYHQIIRIGANIIDQYDTDNFPTTLRFGEYDFYGIEDIPYPNELLTKFITSSPAQIPPSTPNWYEGFSVQLTFEMWNPHQQQAASTNTGATHFRVIVNPEANYFIGTTQLAFNSPTVSGPFSSGTIKFAAQPSDYREPRVIRQDSETPSGDPSVLDFPVPGPKALGFKLVGPAVSGSNPLNTLRNSAWYYTYSSSNAIFSFQYKDDLGNWQTYATSAGLETLPATGIQPAGKWVYVNSAPWGSTDPTKIPAYCQTVNMEGTSYLKSDPRTWRFGMAWGSNYSAPKPTCADNPLIAADGTIFVASQNQPFGSQGARLDWMSQNAGTAPLNTINYPDVDAIIRPGDCYLSGSNQPMKTGLASQRPIVLNRPFRSIGELGFVFRDTPWKSLDLFSANSADGALMDVFSVEDSTLTSGRVNLNTRHKEVLAALLSGGLLTGKPVAEGGATLSGTAAASIAQAIIASGSNSALLDPCALAVLLATGSAQPSFLKTEREAAMRALAGSTSTRTWNLLIDLVVQSGQYPQSATGLDGFAVEGSRHYWMHVAIDRFTGKVIDKSLEIINE